MRFSPRTRRRPLRLLALPVALSLVLAACRDDDAASEPSDTAASTTDAPAETTPSTTAMPDDDHDHDDHDHDDDDHDHDDDHDDDHDHDDDGAAGSEESASEESASEAMEVDEARRLLVVGAHEQAFVDLIDLADGSSESLELASPAAFSSTITESGRYLLAGHDDGVTVVDTGVWSEPHGDHFHHYTAPPTIIGEVDGPNPTHLISHDDLNALWFDGTGSATVIAEETLAAGELTPIAEVPTGQPHHGFAVPTHGLFFLTVPTDDMEHMPNVVGISDSEGVVQAQFDCPLTHGEASLADGAAAACADGVVLATDDDGAWVESRITYPEIDDEDPYGFGPARAWILVPSADRTVLAAPHGSRHLMIADPESATAQSIDVGQGVATLGVAFIDSGDLLVLTHDGVVHLVDTTSGTIVASVDAIAPFEEGDPDQPYRQLVTTGDHVYVSDPANQQIVEIAVGDELTVERAIDLDFVPGLLLIANG